MAKVSIRNFQRKINNLNLLNEEIRRISKSAVKATAQALKEMAIDDITSATGLEENRIYKLITTTTSDEIASVIFSRYRIPLVRYTPTISFRGSRGTVSADISMLRGTQVIGNRVFANPKFPKVPFKRKGDTAKPFSLATGPSVAHHARRIKIDLIRAGEEDLLKRFSKRLENAIKRLQ
ncbi:MAG: hypothetical protein V9H25_06640 [Candidatus Competibacter sp.]